MSAITTLFFDIGGVSLSNGWDHEQRQTIAQKFGIEYEPFNQRHSQVVDSLERGFISFEDYLNWTVFYQPRPFSVEALAEAIKAESTPHDDTLALLRAVRATGRYQLMTINNESRELNEYRIERFGLRDIFSAFFTSCYLGLLKPQPEHYRAALQISQRHPDECLFIDDRPMNAEVAGILGMRPIHFTGAEQLAQELRDAGVAV